MADRWFRIFKDLKVGRLKDEAYVYSAAQSAYRYLPFQNIDDETYDLLSALIDLAGESKIFSASDAKKSIKQIDADTLGSLVEAEYISEANVTGQKKKSSSENITASFDKYACPATFFNIPPIFPDEKADVAIAGLPLAHSFQNHGTSVGLELLRGYTSLKFDWFDIYGKGVYSEIEMSGAGSLICGNIVPKDFGNLGVGAQTLMDIASSLAAFWKKTRENQTKPIFFGGDHAVTFPILYSLNQFAPSLVKNLTVLHLDAHHDCYSPEESANFDHANVISAVLDNIPVKKIISLGLRTSVDPRGRDYLQKMTKHHETGRLDQYGIRQSIEILNDSKRFFSLVGRQDPLYLTFDIDFLCKTEVEGAVWTPVEDGAQWRDLFRCLDLLKSRKNVIGADIVEYNPLGVNATAVLLQLTAALVKLIDVLGPK